MTIPDCRKNWDCHEKIGIAKILGLPDEQPEVSEIPNTQLELTNPGRKPPKLIPTILAQKYEDYYKDG